MTFAYLASFDVTGLGTILLGTAGKTSITITVGNLIAVNHAGTAGLLKKFSHYPRSLGEAIGEDRSANRGLSQVSANISFAGALQAALRTAASTATWPSTSTLTVTFSTTTLRYAIGYTAQPLTAITMATDVRRLLGYSVNFAGSSNLVTGNRTPNYCIEPILRAVTTGDDGYNYEPKRIVLQSRNDFGQSFAVDRRCAPLMRSWIQEFEPREKVVRFGAALAHPFTHQALVESCRTSHPFVVLDGWGDGRDEVFFLTPDGACWSKGRAKRAGGARDDAHYHVEYETLVAGAFA
jgi:hypothetical protein